MIEGAFDRAELLGAYQKSIDDTIRDLWLLSEVDVIKTVDDMDFTVKFTVDCRTTKAMDAEEAYIWLEGFKRACEIHKNR